jgi:hypothetical protein
MQVTMFMSVLPELQGCYLTSVKSVPGDIGREDPAGAGCCEAPETVRLLMLDFYGSGIWTSKGQISLCSAILRSRVRVQRDRLLEIAVLELCAEACLRWSC